MFHTWSTDHSSCHLFSYSQLCRDTQKTNMSYLTPMSSSPLTSPTGFPNVAFDFKIPTAPAPPAYTTLSAASSFHSGCYDAFLQLLCELLLLSSSFLNMLNTELRWDLPLAFSPLRLNEYLVSIPRVAYITLSNTYRAFFSYVYWQV